MTKKASGIDPAITKAVMDLLADATKSTDLKVRMQAIDRALKLEQIRNKIQDEDFGSDFDLRDET